MAEMYMNSESCRSTLSTIRQMRDQLMEQLNAVSGTVDSMVGSTWVAPGANQFQNEYQNWRSNITATIEQLNEFATRLEQEIAKWEAEAATA